MRITVGSGNIELEVYMGEVRVTMVSSSGHFGSWPPSYFCSIKPAEAMVLSTALAEMGREARKDADRDQNTI